MAASAIAKRVASFDPGLTNFAAWSGSLGTDELGRIFPITHRWPPPPNPALFLTGPPPLRIEKIDLKATKKAAYEAAADAVLGSPWMTELGPGGEVVVETQAMRNVPARIVATSIYGVMRGRSIPVCFSGAKLKNEAIGLVAEQYGVPLESKPTKEGMPNAKARARAMHAINKRNSLAVVMRMVRASGDSKTLDEIAGAKDGKGRSKSDDLADAILLGVGLLLSIKKRERDAPQSKKKRCKISSSS